MNFVGFSKFWLTLGKWLKRRSFKTSFATAVSEKNLLINCDWNINIKLFIGRRNRKLKIAAYTRKVWMYEIFFRIVFVPHNVVIFVRNWKCTFSLSKSNNRFHVKYNVTQLSYKIWLTDLPYFFFCFWKWFACSLLAKS